MSNDETAEVAIGDDQAPPHRPKQDRFDSTTAVILLIIFGAVALGVIAQNQRTGDESESRTAAPPRPKDYSVEAWWIMRGFVEDRLKSPSTAEFQMAGHQAVTQTRPGTYEVTSWVDAQNSFGAKLRKRFHCKVSRGEESWYLLDLQWLD